MFWVKIWLDRRDDLWSVLSSVGNTLDIVVIFDLVLPHKVNRSVGKCLLVRNEPRRSSLLDSLDSFDSCPQPRSAKEVKEDVSTGQ